ncbi:GNAT family N-acetyltransferase [Streptomyces sp. Ru71]|uniref:GNAT family N-acetyltransferase n=1 Tax=Streptomyces sp. Ru71 TaxID=2080746 RepID=UPI000CDE107E|nr:GNAT family N-acetyltransferase [Streptomyces sp. Ru71]POX46974.1 GNAT family N-acetyltransferase [Streptomyces sp. Ru71]
MSDWWITGDLDAFLDRAGAFLHSRPAEHTVALTVTDGLRRRGLRAFGDGDPVFGVLERAGRVEAALVATPPWPPNLTRLSETDADALAAHLAALGHELSGVSAERDTAAAFAEAWQRYTGAKAEPHQRQRLYRLDELTVPDPLPPGRARVAEAADRDLLARWFAEFARDVGEERVGDTEAWADSRLAYGGVTLWEAPDGTPVAMAGVTRLIAGQIRVAPVYTPADLRGRGYGGAATATVSRAALDAGADEVLLFTDLANPTSNALYQRIGYRPVADFEVWEFTATAAG